MLTRRNAHLQRWSLPSFRKFFSGDRREPTATGWRLAALFALTIATLSFSGCGVNLQNAAVNSDVRGVRIAGHVHGGAFPIQQAEITLMETQSNGYGGVGKVLEQVKSDSTGYFTFDSNWTCAAGQYAYIVTAAAILWQVAQRQTPTSFR